MLLGTCIAQHENKGSSVNQKCEQITNLNPTKILAVVNLVDVRFHCDGYDQTLKLTGEQVVVNRIKYDIAIL